MDIWIDGPYPACVISNFAPNAFVFDGVPVASMEGLLQAFKFPDLYMQDQVCGMEGIIAKKRGRAMNSTWQSNQTLYWRDTAYPRDSIAYQGLLDRAFLTLAEQSEEFREALRTSGDKPLTHRIGHNNAKETILTQQEFIQRITRLRSYLLIGMEFMSPKI